MVYTYLAGHVGRTGEEGAFRALSRGYTHWASGRIQELQVNTNNPLHCHVQCVTSPSMKTGTYRVYLLLGKEGNFATIRSAQCDCAAGYVFRMYNTYQLFYFVYVGGLQAALMCLLFYMRSLL